MAKNYARSLTRDAGGDGPLLGPEHTITATSLLGVGGADTPLLLFTMPHSGRIQSVAITFNNANPAGAFSCAKLAGSGSPNYTRNATLVVKTDTSLLSANATITAGGHRLMTPASATTTTAGAATTRTSCDLLKGDQIGCFMNNTDATAGSYATVQITYRQTDYTNVSASPVLTEAYD